MLRKKLTKLHKLLQSTTLPQNYLFALLITEINREIEKYTKQRFPITFADKRKERLQIPARTSKQIQLLTWKKQRFDLPANPLYYHTPKSTINIISAATASTTTLLNQIPFQSKQKKAELLGTYVIVINPPPALLIDKQQQQQPQAPPQQQLQQQSQPQQQLTLVLMAYAPITKIKKFISKEDAQVWFNNMEKAITVNGWNDDKALQAILYFLQNTTNLWY
ncbi:hypothetical protein G9A89_004208 [Geosiphon pyriformis]|nr:hypothetical protein G9A89_004208 [Geosiphon pyriformis]